MHWIILLIANCSKERNYVICSNCSSNTHTWRNCNSDVKQCVNCGENHSCLSYVCPRRKEALKSKCGFQTVSPSQSYSAVARLETPGKSTTSEVSIIVNRRES